MLTTNMRYILLIKASVSFFIEKTDTFDLYNFFNVYKKEKSEIRGITRMILRIFHRQNGQKKI